MDQSEAQKNAIKIDDLPVALEQEAEIKGGPNPKSQRVIVLQSGVAVEEQDESSVVSLGKLGRVE
jgi:hypothetical protein